MPRRMLGIGIEVVRRDRVLVEGAGLLAVEEVRKTRRVRQAEDAPSAVLSSRLSRTDGNTYDGSCVGAQTMAMLSGIIIW